jgi:predicted membrane chloride channel (bestrophin family)
VFGEHCSASALFWSINYIAAEIEMPFGEDANDLPIAQLQEGFNTSLRMLIDEQCS